MLSHACVPRLVSRPSVTQQRVVIVLVAFLSLSCSTIGTGTRTIIRAVCEPTPGFSESCDDLAAKYPHLITTNNSAAGRVIVLGANGMPELKASKDVELAAFKDLRLGEYGSADFQSGNLSVNVHDRGSVPALLPIDITQLLANTLTSFAAANSKLPLSSAITLQTFLQARLKNIADLQLVMTPNHQECGINVYYYYPRLSIDFGSVFYSPSLLDKMDFLALQVSLKPAASGETLRPRIVDYYPKASDFVDYNRGQFTEAAQLQAQLAYVSTRGTSEVTGTAPDTTTNTKSTTLGPSTGPQLAGTLSNTYVSQLADSIERRTSAVLDQGYTFYADFRGIRQIRVGGTYNFDLMLEVPSRIMTINCDGGRVPCAPDLEHCETIRPGNYFSQPVESHVVADVTLIGVVRHVYERGHIGAFTHVPELENDDVFEEVVLKRFPNVHVWDFNATPASSPAPPKQDCTLAITSNRDDAEFVVTSETGALISRGSGREGSVAFSSNPSGMCAGRISMMPLVVASGEKGQFTTLLAALHLGSGQIASGRLDGVSYADFQVPAGQSVSATASYAPETH